MNSKETGLHLFFDLAWSDLNFVAVVALLLSKSEKIKTNNYVSWFFFSVALYTGISAYVLSYASITQARL